MGGRYGKDMSHSPNAGIEVKNPQRKFQMKSRVRTLNRVATVMSGELINVGTPVKKVIIDPRGRAATDGETVWIPMKVHEDERINRMAQEAILAHEVAGHLRYTDFGAWKKIGDEIKRGHADRMLHDFTNILEDARVNHLLSQDFGGSGKRLLATQRIFMQRHRDAWAGKTVDEINPRQAAIIAMMTEAIAHEPHFFAHVPEVVAYMDEVRTICATAISQSNTAQVIKQAKRMLKVYRTHFPEDASDDQDTFGMPNGADADGIMTDDMSPEEIEKMAKKQADKNAKPEEVSRQRFQDLKKKIEELKEAAEEAAKAQEESDATPEAGDANEGSESEGEGDSEESGAGEGESDEEADGEGAGEGDEGDDAGDAGEGDSDSDSDCAGESAGDSGEGESDSASETGEPCEGTTSEDLGETDSDSDDMNAGGAKGADLSDIDMDEMWAELQAEMDAERQDAFDLEKDFSDEVDASQDSDDALDPTFNTSLEGDDSGHECHITHTTQEFIDRGEVDTDSLASGFLDIVAQNKSQITTMVNEMKRLLKGANNKHTRGLKRGMLDSKRIAFHKTNDRLFMRKNEQQRAEANVMILIDSSGSMGGSRAESAAQAAVVLSEVMDKLGWGCEVVDFASSRHTAIRVRKQMKAPLNNITRAAIRQPTAGGCNGDGYAVEWCLDRLQKFSGNRMLFVLSDGQPSGPAPSHMDNDTHLKFVVDNAPKDIGLFSIGIDGMNTGEYYANAVINRNNADLVKDCMPVIRKMVRTVKNKA